MTDRTRSGRSVKKSIKYVDNEEIFEDDGALETDDKDYKVDELSMESYDDEMEFEKDVEMRKVRSRKRKVSDVTFKDKPKSRPTLSIMGMLPNKNFPAPGSDDSIESNSLVYVPKYTSAAKLTMSVAIPKEDEAAKFYLKIQKALSNPTLIYPSTVTDSTPFTMTRDITVVDISGENYPTPKFDAKLPITQFSSEKTSDKIKDIIGIEIDMEELQRYSRINTYFFYNIISRKKAELSGQHSQQQQQSAKEVARAWTKMPERTRRDWEIKTNKVKRLLEENRRRQLSEDALKRDRRQAAARRALESMDNAKLTDYNVIDLAGYLKLLSNGMANIATKLKDSESKKAVQIEDVESTLLDFLLCSMVSLVALFEENEGLDRPVSTDSLNKLTFVLPGLN